LIEVIRNQGVNAPGKRHVTVIIHRTHYSLGDLFPSPISWRLWPCGRGRTRPRNPRSASHALALGRCHRILGLRLMHSSSQSLALWPTFSKVNAHVFFVCVCVCGVCVCVCVCVCLIGTDRQTCRSGKKIHERVIRHLRYIYYVELI
jgi:hypothetical protein